MLITIIPLKLNYHSNVNRFIYHRLIIHRKLKYNPRNIIKYIIIVTMI